MTRGADTRTVGGVNEVNPALSEHLQPKTSAIFISNDTLTLRSGLCRDPGKPGTLAAPLQAAARLPTDIQRPEPCG